MSGPKVDRELLRAVIAAHLRGVMAENDIKAPKVAELTGLHTATVYRLINGERPIEVEVLEMFAEAVGFNAGEFMDDAKGKYLKKIAGREVEHKGDTD